MSGGGCKTCPVKGCDAQYRGSQCAALRAKAGADSDPMTNADRIRSMSDEELAEFIESQRVCQICHPKMNNCFPADIFRWLQQPAPEVPDETDT